MFENNQSILPVIMTVSVSQEADFAIGGISIIEQRQAVIDFIYPHYEEKSAVFMNLGWHRWDYFYVVFDKVLLSCVLCLPVFVAVVVWSFQFIDRTVQHRSYWGCLPEYVFVTYGNLTLQGIITFTLL